MNYWMLSLALWGAQFLPGPDFALVTRSSIRYGSKYGAVCALGIGSALLIHSLIVCFGASYLFQQGNIITQIILGISALWLSYLAWKMWPKSANHQTSTLDEEENAELPPPSHLYKQAFMTNLLNPKCVIFLATISSSVLASHGGSLTSIIVVISLVVGQGIVGWAAWSYALRLGPINRVLQNHVRLLDRIFACLLGLFIILILHSLLSPLWA